MARKKIKQLYMSEREVSRQIVEAAGKIFGINLKRRNTGGFYNESGQYVACGEPGDSDYYAQMEDSRYLEIEIKKENFDPDKIYGKNKQRYHDQFRKLQETNRKGGVGFFCSDVKHFVMIMRAVTHGAHVCQLENGQVICWYEDKEKLT